VREMSSPELARRIGHILMTTAEKVGVPYNYGQLFGAAAWLECAETCLGLRHFFSGAQQRLHRNERTEYSSATQGRTRHGPSKGLAAAAARCSLSLASQCPFFKLPRPAASSEKPSGRERLSDVPCTFIGITRFYADLADSGTKEE
jgi:hypothetical protein